MVRWEELMSFGKIEKSLDFTEILIEKLIEKYSLLTGDVYEIFNPISFLS